MTPTVRTGQRVRVRAKPAVHRGDVVLFETTTGQALVLHRIVFAPAWSSWFVHVGDAGQRAGISRRERIIGVADLPRRRPNARAMVRASARVVQALARFVRR